MKLPADSVISERKLRAYLLSPRIEDDKSGLLFLAGYTEENWRQLEADLRQQIEAVEAELIRVTDYGDMYKVRARLTGPNGKRLNVITIWITLRVNGETRFVTLIPDKEKRI
jgi:hypothetical protein